ncbi:MAG: hypothetical protein Q4F41_07550 [Eubacteriales bacterium]|nr:hypothetical protein [Eubacteriales bacterium]
MKQKRATRVISLVTMGLLSAILLVAQVSLAFLPNIELVTLLIILYTLVYKKQVFLIIYAFVLLEGVLYGFGIWWISYLYVWPLLALVVLAMRKNQSVVIWAVAAGAYGLAFGALTAIPYLISGGPGAAFAYWAAGIPYDIIHCASNFVLTLVLFKPLFHLLTKLHTSQVNAFQGGGSGAP